MVYSRKEIEGHILTALVDTHSRYKFMVTVVFPLWNQQPFLNVYPSVARALLTSLSDGVIIGISKLLDNANDRYLIHFKRFLHEAFLIPLEEVKNKSQWADFEKKGKAFLKELPDLKHKLDPLRNSFRAHISPKKPVPIEEAPTTWEWLRGVLERMEELYNLYTGSLYDSSHGQFYTANLDTEPEMFLKWARLDHFEKHRRRSLSARRAARMRRSNRERLT